MISRRKTRTELRKFGFTVGAVLAVAAAILFWKGRPAASWLAAVAGFLLGTGLIAPAFLRPIEFAWMKLALVLSGVSTRVILTVAFFLVIAPAGIALRLARKDLLSLRFDPSKESYWITTEADGPGTRPEKPF